MTISGSSDAPSLGGIATLKVGSNIGEFLKPWQWPALLPNFIFWGISAALLMGRAKSHVEWHLTAIMGYAALFMVANAMEFRAFGDLIGFAAVSLVLILRERITIVTKTVV